MQSSIASEMVLLFLYIFIFNNQYIELFISYLLAVIHIQLSVRYIGMMCFGLKVSTRVTVINTLSKTEIFVICF